MCRAVAALGCQGLWLALCALVTFHVIAEVQEAGGAWRRGDHQLGTLRDDGDHHHRHFLPLSSLTTSVLSDAALLQGLDFACACGFASAARGLGAVRIANMTDIANCY